MYQVSLNDAEQVRQATLCLDNGLHLEGGDWMRILAEQEGKPIVSCTDGIEPLMLNQNGNKKVVPDPHAWFSVKNAVQYTRNITTAIVERDLEHAEEYRARATLLIEQLRTLHNWITRQVNAVPGEQRVLVTSHDAFNYFCDAYGFKSTSPIGWSTQEVGAEVTPQRRQQVVAAIRDAGVPAIFIETSVNPKLIRDIAKESGVAIGGTLYSDSMGAPGTAGETYIGMMAAKTC